MESRYVIRRLLGPIQFYRSKSTPDSSPILSQTPFSRLLLPGDGNDLKASTTLEGWTNSPLAERANHSLAEPHPTSRASSSVGLSSNGQGGHGSLPRSRPTGGERSTPGLNLGLARMPSRGPGGSSLAAAQRGQSGNSPRDGAGRHRTWVSSPQAEHLPKAPRLPQIAQVPTPV